MEAILNPNKKVVEDIIKKYGDKNRNSLFTEVLHGTIPELIDIEISNDVNIEEVLSKKLNKKKQYPTLSNITFKDTLSYTEYIEHFIRDYEFHKFLDNDFAKAFSLRDTIEYVEYNGGLYADCGSNLLIISSLDSSDIKKLFVNYHEILEKIGVINDKD